MNKLSIVLLSLVFSSIPFANSQASTKVFFSHQGEFIIRDNNGNRIITKQDYTIQKVQAWIYAETDSNNKAFGQWKNCFESKHDSVEFPIPWTQTTYQPFTEIQNDIQLSFSVDQNEKTITVDEAQVANLISEAADRLNQRTAGKCRVKSVLNIRVEVQPQDGSNRNSLDVAFAARDSNLFVRYTDVKFANAYSVDATKKLTSTLPNYNTLIPVYGQGY